MCFSYPHIHTCLHPTTTPPFIPIDICANLKYSRPCTTIESTVIHGGLCRFCSAAQHLEVRKYVEGATEEWEAWRRQEERETWSWRGGEEGVLWTRGQMEDQQAEQEEGEQEQKKQQEKDFQLRLYHQLYHQQQQQRQREYQQHGRPIPETQTQIQRQNQQEQQQVRQTWYGHLLAKPVEQKKGLRRTDSWNFSRPQRCGTW